MSTKIDTNDLAQKAQVLIGEMGTDWWHADDLEGEVLCSFDRTDTEFIEAASPTVISALITRTVELETALAAAARLLEQWMPHIDQRPAQYLALADKGVAFE